MVVEDVVVEDVEVGGHFARGDTNAVLKMSVPNFDRGAVGGEAGLLLASAGGT